MTNKYQTLSALEYINRFPSEGESFVIDWNNGEDNAPSMSIFVLENVFLYPSGIIIGKKRKAIKDSIIRDAHINMLVDQIEVENNENDYIDLNGEYVSLLGPWSNGFWHWMMEFLDKVIMAEAAGFNGHYLVMQGQSEFILNSLEMLGITQERVLSYDINKPVLVKKLFLPERIVAGFDAKYLFLLNLLRKKLMKGISTRSSSLKRIYISRKNAKNGRRIVNETELMELLEEYSFEAAIMEHKPLKAQIELMANSEWLIGANGAGIVHCLFMPESSCLMELFSPSYINPCMLSAVKLLKHNYYMITSPHNGDYKSGSDIEAPIELIKLTLESRLKGRARHARARSGSSLTEKSKGQYHGK